MRKILYRAKSLEKDNLGEWVYGDLVHHNEEAFYILPQNREYSELYTHGILVDENTIGQFIGIYDVNRKEVYEGDIITSRGRMTGGHSFKGKDEILEKEAKYKNCDIFLAEKNIKIEKMKNIEAKRFNKVLILKDVKNFTYTIEELAYHTEMYGFLNELELEAFTRVFYRNKKLNKLYIFDANYSVTIIEFSKKMNWRNQKG